MMDITARPMLIGSYWRPWKPDSNLADSFLDFIKDKSLVRYGSTLVGDQIDNGVNSFVKAVGALSEKQISTIESAAAGQRKAIEAASVQQIAAINNVADMLGERVDKVSQELGFMSRSLDMLHEQQRLSNKLLNEIVELLKIPDIEKERQYCITNGIKFFINASQNEELFEDSLEEFLKAEKMRKQDYFVLYRIGCIYLYVPQFYDPEKALDYFRRALKYSSVEIPQDSARMNNPLANSLNSFDYNDISSIRLIASDSASKAAFASYVLGKDSDAVLYQTRANEYMPTPEGLIILSKYQVRNGNTEEAIRHMQSAISSKPVLVSSVFADYDLMLCKEIVDHIKYEVASTDIMLDELLDEPKYAKWASLILSTKSMSDHGAKQNLLKYF